MNWLVILAPLFLLSPVYGSQCSVSGNQYPIPSNIGLSSTIGSYVKETYAILGTRNYTCSSSGIYIYDGPMSEMYDTSCHYNTACFKHFRKRDIALGNDSPEAWYYEAYDRQCLGPDAKPTANLYFEMNPSHPWTYHFDYVDNNVILPTTASVTNTYSAPNKTGDAPWEYITFPNSQDYNFAISLYTHFGMPRPTCQPGDHSEVRYSAQLYLYSSNSNNGNSNSGSKNVGALSTNSNSSDPDSSSVQQLLNYAPALVGLLVLTTLTSFVILCLAIFFIYRHRASLVHSRVAPVYQPVKLPRPNLKQPLDENYYDEETYGT